MITSRSPRPASRSRVALPLLVALALAAGSCGEPLSQIAVVVDTALCEPGDGAAADFDRVRITVDGIADPFCAVFADPGASDCVQISSADFPLVLPLVSESGTGTATVQVELLNGAETVACATGTPSFEAGATVAVRIDVERPCGGASCADGMTTLEPGTDPLALPPRTCEPASPAPVEPILRLAAGAQHACLVDSRGDLFCWGNDDFGQLGIGGGAPSRARPTRVPGLVGFVEDVDGGQSHTCVVRADGADRFVSCWGRGDDGQLGNGMTASSGNPLTVRDLIGPAGVALGPFHSCAFFDSDGHVECWGNDMQGEVTGTPGGTERTPLTVGVPDGPSGTPDALELAAGGSNVDEARHSCARTSHGVYCWGSNASGQLGRPGDTSAVAAVEGLPEVTQIAAGSRATCAADAAGQIFCWGRNNTPGTLGIATSSLTDVSTPTRIDADTAVLPPVAVPTGGPALSTLASGDNFRCFIDGAGAVHCLGDNSRERLGSPGAGTPMPRAVGLPAGTRFKQIVTGTNFACALPEDGSMPFCWGDNSVGQLGRGTSGGTGEPSPVPSCE